MKQLFAVLLILASFSAFAQEGCDIGPNDKVEYETKANPTNFKELMASIEYPAEAIENGIEGMLIAKVLVSEEGSYVKHLVIRTPGNSLTKVADELLPKLKFEAALKDGKPSCQWLPLPLKFKLP